MKAPRCCALLGIIHQGTEPEHAGRKSTLMLLVGVDETRYDDLAGCGLQNPYVAWLVGAVLDTFRQEM